MQFDMFSREFPGHHQLFTYVAPARIQAPISSAASFQPYHIVQPEQSCDIANNDAMEGRKVVEELVKCRKEDLQEKGEEVEATSPSKDQVTSR